MGPGLTSTCQSKDVAPVPTDASKLTSEVLVPWIWCGRNHLIKILLLLMLTAGLSLFIVYMVHVYLPRILTNAFILEIISSVIVLEDADAITVPEDMGTITDTMPIP